MDLIDLLRQRFVNRTDVFANYMTPQNRPCPIRIEGEPALRSCLAAHLGMLKHSADHIVKGKTIGRKTINRIGAYTPGPSNTTRWMCLDFDGKGHSDALKDPLAMAQLALHRARTYGLSTHLEKSGGGRGWHVWLFFDEPIHAKEARALGLGIVPRDAPLIGGGSADPEKSRAIEVFPKITQLRSESGAVTGLGHMVWLPFWGGAPTGCAQFYSDDGTDELFDPTLDLTDSYAATEAVGKLEVTEPELEAASLEREVRADRNDVAFDDIAWDDWRTLIYDRAPLDSIYRLTGKKNSGGWLECRTAEGEDKNPSAAVNDGSTASRGLYHDYKSNETLNVIDYVMKYVRAGDSFLNAARWLADLTSVALPKAPARPGRVDEPPPIESLDELAISMPEAFSADAEPEKQEIERMKVNANEDEREVVQKLWWAINRLPVFSSGDAIVHVRRGEVKPLSSLQFRALLNECVQWIRWKKNEDAFEEVPAKPNQPAIGVAHSASWKARSIRMVTSAPIFSPSGELILKPGYHARARVYYAPRRLKLPPVPEAPTSTDVTKAHTLIFGKLLRDFPFVDQRSRAHAVAALLNPLVRLMIDGPTPLYVYSAPTSGTGKSLLAGLCPLLYYGWIKTRSLSGRNEEENRKAIHSYLLSDPGGVIYLDNFRGRLEDPALEAAITARRFGGRILGGNTVADPEMLSTLLITLNNPKMNTDTHRRSVVVRLDSKEVRPEFRKNFAIARLARWAYENRPDLLWALTVMVQAWLHRGAIEAPTSMGSFEHYAGTMGGILQANGVDGFLEKRSDDVSDEELELQNFVEAWWSAFAEQLVRAKQVVSVVTERDASQLASRLQRAHNEAGRVSIVGVTMSGMAGRVFKLDGERSVAVHKRGRGYMLSLQTGQKELFF